MAGKAVEIPGWDDLKDIAGDLQTLKLAARVMLPVLSQAMALAGLDGSSQNAKLVVNQRYYRANGDTLARGAIGSPRPLNDRSSATDWSEFAVDLPRIVEWLARNERVRAVSQVAGKVGDLAQTLAS